LKLIFGKKNNPSHIFGFDMTTLKKLRLNFSKCKPSPFLPSTTTESINSLGSVYILSSVHKVHDYFLVSID